MTDQVDLAKCMVCNDKLPTTALLPCGPFAKQRGESEAGRRGGTVQVRGIERLERARQRADLEVLSISRNVCADNCLCICIACADARRSTAINNLLYRPQMRMPGMRPQHSGEDAVLESVLLSACLVRVQDGGLD